MKLPVGTPLKERLTAKQRAALLELAVTARWIMDIGPGMVRRLKARGLVEAADNTQVFQGSLFWQDEPLRIERRRQASITASGKALILTTTPQP